MQGSKQLSEKKYAIRIFKQPLPDPLNSLHPLAPLPRPVKLDNISNPNSLHPRLALEWQVRSIPCSVQVVSEQTPSVNPHYIGQGGALPFIPFCRFLLHAPMR